MPTQVQITTYLITSDRPTNPRSTQVTSGDPSPGHRQRRQTRQHSQSRQSYEQIQPTNAERRQRSQSRDRRRDGHNENKRSVLQRIANETITSINNGIVDVTSTKRYTHLYLHDSPRLVNWHVHPPHQGRDKQDVEINILPLTTLAAARFLYNNNQTSRIGILNFASATSPGGGFLSGAQAQEESIARSSTLYVSLTTEAARPFYAMHHRDHRDGFYTHSMIYSPDVHLLRDDDGNWLSPMKVDVLTSPAVNAKEVRKNQRRRQRVDVENDIRKVMYERMARILALFEGKGARQIVLGSFGTGVFQNDVQAMAGLWRELLFASNARFAHSFDFVVFAIPEGGDTGRKFALGFYIDQTQGNSHGATEIGS